MKLKDFWSKYKKSLLKVLVLIAVVASIGLMVIGILTACSVIEFDGGIHFNVEMFDYMRHKWWAYLVFILFQVIIAVLLVFVPATSMITILLGVALFGASWQCFLVCFSGVVISSLLMDILGRYGGARIVKWLIGEDEFNLAQNLLKTKKYTYLPFMYLLPVFPDDALCMVAGISKIKFWYHATIIVSCRGIGVTTIVFGLNLIPYQDFTSFYEWFLLGAALIIYVSLLLKVANYLDKKMTAVLEKREQAKKEN